MAGLMDLALAVGGLLLVGVVTSIVRIALGARPASEPTREMPHPGIRMDAIPVSGAAGLIFTLGYSWMFLAFTRQLWPWLVALLLLGVLLGVASVGMRKPAGPRSGPLSLGQEHQSDDEDDEDQESERGR